MSETTHVDICICTFRRKHIAETIESIAEMVLNDDLVIRLIIADNDVEPSAKSLVHETALRNGLDVHYVHAPSCNISIARNACLDAVTAPYVAFIDDDELVTEQWLNALMQTLQSSKADIAVGPVKAIYNCDTPEWVIAGDFHSIYPVFVNGEIRTGASNNILMRYTPALFGNLRFRINLGKSGGEDTVFFHTLWSEGARFVYSPEAVVTEYVPKDRATLLWLLRRRFRYGQTHGSILLSNSPGIAGRFKNIMLCLVKGHICLGGAVVNAWRINKFRFWLLRGTLHFGAVAKLFGKKEIECY